MKPDYSEYRNAWHRRFKKRRQRRLMLKQQAHEIAIEAASAIAKHFDVQGVYLFGSVLREDDYFCERSDIDLAVEGLAPEKYFPMLVMIDRTVESPFEINVVSLETCDSILKQKVLSEGELLGAGILKAEKLTGATAMSDEPARYLRLISEIKLELNKIMTFEDKIQIVLKQNIPEFVITSTVGKVLHDFYTGIENIFERIARETGEGVPAGESWHKELLTAMTLDIERVRQHVIDSKLASELDEYRRFRHIFRNIYGGELKWDEMKHLADKMPEVLKQLEESVREFCRFLKMLAE